MKSLRPTIAILVVAACVLLAARFAAEERRSSHTRAAVARHEASRDRSERTPAERKAIARVQRPAGVRAAEDVDGLESDSRDELVDVYGTYHPYFVRGDLDGDGRLDFAQAYVYKVGAEDRFDVAVFFGNEDGSFSGPVFVERALDLAAGDLAIERTVLIVTPDLSQDDVHRWRWEANEQRFRDADEGKETDEDAPDETPDERPRARV